METVILANGIFPTHPRAAAILNKADFIIACDGAADKLLAANKTPNLIIGDLDSLNPKTLQAQKKITLKVARQDNTDLMKALDWCLEQGMKVVSILGATGGREDHTLGNLFVLTTYAQRLKILLYTDTGYFTALTESGDLQSHKGQQISLFPQPLDMRITTKGLKFPLQQQQLSYMHSGTLNEAEGAEINLVFDKGVLLVYQTYD